MVKWTDTCPSHPEYGTEHECMASERRCVYCGKAIEAYGCHGCNEFLSAEEMHRDEAHDCHRCRECLP